MAADADGILEAARLILAGQPVAVPTETVYGLAADAASGEAVARIYAAKGRPSFNPLIVHVAGLEEAERLGRFDGRPARLRSDGGRGRSPWWCRCAMARASASLVTAGLPSIALRASAHPVMQAVIAATGRPLAAPSANASGRISATRADHVLASLGGRIPLILDGGPTAHGLESTIVAATGVVAAVAPGLDHRGAAWDRGGARFGADGIEAPGQMSSHYAPAKPLRLNATEPAPGEWMIGFGAVAGHAA
jgi:L-threonylcarbamoyladenylate synthase